MIGDNNHENEKVEKSMLAIERLMGFPDREMVETIVDSYADDVDDIEGLPTEDEISIDGEYSVTDFIVMMQAMSLSQRVSMEAGNSPLVVHTMYVMGKILKNNEELEEIMNAIEDNVMGPESPKQPKDIMFD